MKQFIKALPLLMAALPALYVFLFGAVCFGPGERSRVVAAKSQIEQLQAGLRTYHIDTGEFPTEAQGLAALHNNPGVKGWDGPYVRKEIPRDPWNVPYFYRLLDGKPHIAASH